MSERFTTARWSRTLEDFMFENLFGPLDLRETFFYISEAKSGQLPAFRIPLQPPGDLGLLLQYQEMVYGALSDLSSAP